MPAFFGCCLIALAILLAASHILDALVGIKGGIYRASESLEKIKMAIDRK